MVDVRFQQIQKYECAANKISACTLWRLALALQAPASYFFEDVNDAAAKVRSTGPRGDLAAYCLDNREAEAVQTLLGQLRPGVQKRLFALTQSFEDASAELGSIVH